ncbi:MAG: PspC domain-containing protein [Prevotellaceae bacterium]|nr:PspC domain-containing protein [Candidatus Colivivens equi]
MNEKKLRKSKNKMIGGICGGFAEYLNIDPTLVRVLYVFLTLLAVFCGIILYIACLFIMPDEA